MLDPETHVGRRIPKDGARARRRTAALGLPLVALACAADPGPLAGEDDGLFGPLRTLGGPGGDRAEALAVTATGDPVIAGRYADGFEIGSFSAPGGPGVFVARLERSGAPRWLWSAPLAGAGLAQLRLELDPGDGPVLAATVQGGALDLGESPLPAEGPSDLLVAQLSPSGALRRAARLGGPGLQTLNGLAVGPRGGIWLSGRFARLDLDLGAPLRATGEADAFVARLGRDLSPRWIRPARGPDFASATALAVSHDQTCVAAVRFEGALEVDGRRLEATTGAAALLRLDPGGRALDARVAADSAGGIELLDAAFDRRGTVHLGGSFRGRLGLSRGPPALRSPDVAGLWLRWRQDGALEAGALGGSGADRVRFVSVDAYGRTWLSGRFETRVQREARPLRAGPRPAAFAARVDRDGRVRLADAVRAGPGGAVYPAGIAAGGATAGWWLGGFSGRATAGARAVDAAGGGDLLLSPLEPR